MPIDAFAGPGCEGACELGLLPVCVWELRSFLRCSKSGWGERRRMQMHRAHRRPNAQAESDAMSVVEEGAVLAQYLPTGKLKNSRYFWVSVEEGTLCWDKKKNQKANKTAPLLSVQPEPVLKSAREWFDTIDADGSGELDATELATLYRTAREETLSKKDLTAAMVCDALPPLSHISPD